MCSPHGPSCWCSTWWISCASAAVCTSANRMTTSVQTLRWADTGGRRPLQHAEDTATRSRWAKFTRLPAMEMITVRPAPASAQTRGRPALSHPPVTRRLTGDPRPCPPGSDAWRPGCAGVGLVRTNPEHGVAGNESVVSAVGNGLVPREDTTRLRAGRCDQHAEGQRNGHPGEGDAEATSGGGRALRRGTVLGCRRLKRRSRQRHIGGSDVRGSSYINGSPARGCRGLGRGLKFNETKAREGKPAPFLKCRPPVVGITSVSGPGGARSSTEPAFLSKLAAHDRPQAPRRGVTTASASEGIRGSRWYRLSCQRPRSAARSTDH
jgi:hypothetical protein